MSWSPDPQNRPAKIFRMKEPSGRTVGFNTTDGGTTGRSNMQYFEPRQVPEFAGDIAFFAVERVRGGRRIVKLLHQVATPPGETTEVPPIRPPAPWPDTHPPKRH